MNRTRPQIIVNVVTVTILGALIFVLAKGLTFDPQHQDSPLIDSKAFKFDVPSLYSGDHVRLEDFAGQPVILNFWASWCKSCQSEAGQLQEFHNRHSGKVKVIGMTVQDEMEHAKKYARLANKDYLLAFDKTGQTSIQFGVTGVPETFIIDAHGYIRAKLTGPVTVASLEKATANIIN